MKIERIKLTDLRPDEQNARKHDQANLKAIAGSLDQFGQRKPIVITQDNRVVAGNGTLTAAKLLDWKEIDCVRVPADWTANQIKAYALADNRTAELAEWDEQVMASQLLELQEAGFDIEEFGFELINPPTEDESEAGDEIPEVIEPRTKLGQIWQLGRHRLMCGDTTDQASLDRLLDGAVIEMVFTDPPYGIAHSGKGITGNAKANDFGQILNDSDTKIARDFFELCQNNYPKSKMIFWGANYYPQSLPNGFGWIVWDKQREGETFSGAELAFVNHGIRVDVYRHQWHGMIKASERGEARVHPTQKPVALVEWCFTQYGNPKTILDGFGGSGSTLIAAEKTNRTCFMMELDPKYCDVIIQRWENLTGQKAELVNASR